MAKIVGIISFFVLSTIFLSIPRSDPSESKWGDIRTGWPLIYGTDQGDVMGEFIFLAHFSWVNFSLNLLIALLCAFAIYFIIRKKERENNLTKTLH